MSGPGRGSPHLERSGSLDVYALLSGGDRRSVGKADEVAEAIEQDPELFDTVFDGMLLDDPLLRMRCADAVEKATRKQPQLLRCYATRLLTGLAERDRSLHDQVARVLEERAQADSPVRASARKMLARLLS